MKLTSSAALLDWREKLSDSYAEPALKNKNKGIVYYYYNL